MSDQLIRVQIPVTPTAFSLKRKTWHDVKQRNIEAVFDCLKSWEKRAVLQCKTGIAALKKRTWTLD